MALSDLRTLRYINRLAVNQLTAGDSEDRLVDKASCGGAERSSNSGHNHPNISCDRIVLPPR